MFFSLNNCKFHYFVDHSYPTEFEIKDTTYTDRSVAYLDIHLDIDSEGRKRTNLHDKDHLNFSNVNFQFYMYSNSPAAPAYGVCGSYQDVLDRGLLLSKKLPNQRFLCIG
jgi:hypothetical protein